MVMLAERAPSRFNCRPLTCSGAGRGSHTQRPPATHCAVSLHQNRAKTQPVMAALAAKFIVRLAGIDRNCNYFYTGHACRSVVSGHPGWSGGVGRRIGPGRGGAGRTAAGAGAVSGAQPASVRRWRRCRAVAIWQRAAPGLSCRP